MEDDSVQDEDSHGNDQDEDDQDVDEATFNMALSSLGNIQVEDDDEEMDDDAMFKMDEAIAAVFRTKRDALKSGNYST